MFVIVEQNGMWPFGTPGFNVLSMCHCGRDSKFHAQSGSQVKVGEFQIAKMRINLGYVVGCLLKSEFGNDIIRWY